MDQLESLKLCGPNDLRLPSETIRCGLITRTDAERLCATLLNQPNITSSTSSNSFKVYHECFGKVTGTFNPDIYRTPSSRCIECHSCKKNFSTCEFVRHSHVSYENSSNKESTTCHWGFDSNKWRDYLLLARNQECKERAEIFLDSVKRKFVMKENNENSKSLSESAKRLHKSDTELEDVDCEGELHPKRRRNNTISYSKQLLLHQSSFTAYQPWNNTRHPLKLKYSSKPIVPSIVEESPLLEPVRSVNINNGNRLERNYTPNVTLARPTNSKLIKPVPTKIAQTNDIIECSNKIEDLNSSSGASSMSSTDSSDLIRSKDDKVQELSVSVPKRKMHHNKSPHTNMDNEKIQALRIANASLQKQLEIALQKVHEGEVKRSDMLRIHHAENQQLTAEFHHSLMAIDSRWRNIFGEQNIAQYMEQIRQAQLIDDNKVKT